MPRDKAREPDELLASDYYNGRDTPEARRKAEAAIRRRRREVEKKADRKMPLFREQFIEKELAARPIPTVEEKLEEKRWYAERARRDQEERARREAEHIRAIKAEVLEI